MQTVIGNRGEHGLLQSCNLLFLDVVDDTFFHLLRINVLYGLSRCLSLPRHLYKMKLLSASLFALSGCNGFHPESASSRSFSSLGSLPKNEEVVAPLDWRKTATSIVVAATLGWGVACGPAYADDFADFSLPSYEAVSRAEVNTNLKGNKFLIDEASSASR